MIWYCFGSLDSDERIFSKWQTNWKRSSNIWIGRERNLPFSQAGEQCWILANNEHQIHPWRLELEICPDRLPCGHPYRHCCGCSWLRGCRCGWWCGCCCCCWCCCCIICTLRWCCGDCYGCSWQRGCRCGWWCGCCCCWMTTSASEWWVHCRWSTLASSSANFTSIHFDNSLNTCVILLFDSSRRPTFLLVLWSCSCVAKSAPCVLSSSCCKWLIVATFSNTVCCRLSTVSWNM